MSGEVPFVADHVARALARLSQQFSRSGTVADSVKVLAERAQDLESAFFDQLAASNIETAVGAQLDIIGEIVGCPRAGMDDETYRARIKTQVVINAGSGTANEIIHIATLLLGEGNFDFTPGETAEYSLVAIGPVSIGEELPRLIITSTAAGVKVWVEWSDFPDAQTLTLNSNVPGTRLNEGVLAHARSS